MFLPFFNSFALNTIVRSVEFRNSKSWDVSSRSRRHFIVCRCCFVSHIENTHRTAVSKPLFYFFLRVRRQWMSECVVCCLASSDQIFSSKTFFDLPQNYIISSLVCWFEVGDYSAIFVLFMQFKIRHLQQVQWFEEDFMNYSRLSAEKEDRNCSWLVLLSDWPERAKNVKKCGGDENLKLDFNRNGFLGNSRIFKYCVGA